MAAVLSKDASVLSSDVSQAWQELEVRGKERVKYINDVKATRSEIINALYVVFFALV